MARGYMPPAQSVEWETPQDLFDELDAEFHFTLDPCASHENAKCEKYYTKEEDGLSKSWSSERVFMNPPYGKALNKWVRKAYMEIRKIEGAEIVVGLLPVRSDTRWFHDWIYHKAEFRLLKGRLKFKGSNGTRNSATFPSMIVVWRR